MENLEQEENFIPTKKRKRKRKKRRRRSKGEGKKEVKEVSA